MSRNLGLVKAHAIRLEQLLQLPPGHCIVSATWNEQLQEVQFVIEGPSMPTVKPGEMIPAITPTLQLVKRTGTLKVLWP